MKKQMICITGNIAVGKSEVAKRIANKLGFELYKASNAFREIARNMDMNLLEFCEYVNKNPDIDKKIEQNTKDFADTHSRVIIDARLGFYVAPNAFKVYMTSDIDVAAERLLIAAKSRGKEEEYSSIEEAKHAIVAREKSERDRYKELYNVDIENLNQYDFVIDTTHLSATEVTDKIVEAYTKWEGE